MPGKVDQMPRYNRQSSQKEYSGGNDNSIDEEPSGIYLNEIFLQTLAMLQGCDVTVKTKCAKSFQGIFVSVSPRCEILLNTVHELLAGREDILPIRADVIDEMVFALEDVVSLSAATDTDSMSRVSSFAVDAEISRNRFNGDAEKEFVSWEPDHDDERGALEDHQHSNSMGARYHSSSGDHGGWTVDEMFEKNKAIGVDSTFDDNLTQYTNVHPDEEDPEYETKRAHAERLAREIENNPVSKRHQDLENDDEERDLNRDNFGSVAPHRGATSPRFQSNSLQFSRRPDRREGRGGGPRMGGGPSINRGDNRDNNRNNLQQGATITFTNRERRGGGGGSNFGPRMNAGNYAQQQQQNRYGGHERSPVGSADDSNWREVKSRSNQRMDRRMDSHQMSQSVSGPGGGPSPTSPQGPPPAGQFSQPPPSGHAGGPHQGGHVHSETMPRLGRQGSKGVSKQDKDAEISKFREFSEGFHLKLNSAEQPQRSQHHNQQHQQKQPAPYSSVVTAQLVGGGSPGKQKREDSGGPSGPAQRGQEGSQRLMRSGSGHLANQHPGDPQHHIQTVTAPHPPAVVAEQHVQQQQQHIPQSANQQQGPSPSANERKPPPPGQNIGQQQGMMQGPPPSVQPQQQGMQLQSAGPHQHGGPAESPMGGGIQAPHAGIHERTPDLKGEEEGSEASSKKEFRLNPNARVFTPGGNNNPPSAQITQRPSREQTPINNQMQQAMGAQGMSHHQMPQQSILGGYPAPSQSPAGGVVVPTQNMYPHALVPGGQMMTMSQVPVQQLPTASTPIAYYQTGQPGQPVTQLVVSQGAVATMQQAAQQQQQIQQVMAAMQYSQSQQTFTAGPPPNMQQGGGATGPRGRGARMNGPGGSNMHPIMTPGVVPNTAQFAQAGAVQQGQGHHVVGSPQYPMIPQGAQYQTGIPAHGNPAYSQSAAIQRMIQPGYVIQQDGQVTYAGVPQTPTVVGQTGQPGGGIVINTGAMNHPPPPSSNNSGASHSNNASQPPTPGPQSNPSPAPYQMAQYSQPPQQQAVYMGPGNQMVPMGQMVQMQLPNGQVAFVAVANAQAQAMYQQQMAAQEGAAAAAYVQAPAAGYPVAQPYIRTNSNASVGSFLTAQSTLGHPPQGPPPHVAHQQGNN